MAGVIFGRESLLRRSADLGVSVVNTGIDTVDENRNKVKKMVSRVFDTGLVALQVAEKAMICASTGEDDLEKAITQFKKDSHLLDNLWEDDDDDLFVGTTLK